MYELTTSNGDTFKRRLNLSLLADLKAATFVSHLFESRDDGFPN